MNDNKCPCGKQTYPDPLCDMCDGWQNDPDVGWGGFTDWYLGRHFNSEEERKEYLKHRSDDEEYDESYIL